MLFGWSRHTNWLSNHNCFPKANKNDHDMSGKFLSPIQPETFMRNFRRSQKVQKSDRHSNWIEVATAFYHFGWKGWRNATPWMTPRLTWPTAVHTGAPGYHTPKQITAFISFNRPIYIKMWLWVTQKGERVFGRSYSLFYCLFWEALILWTPRVC